MVDEVTQTSCYTYESDEEGIKDLEHFRRELDLYEREFLMVRARAEIFEEEKNSLEKENSKLLKISEEKDAEIASLKTQISETEKSHEEALATQTKEM